MSKEHQLQQKLRSSSALTETDVYLDFMTYACEVRDQLQVYLYMEENGIGLDQADYWLARFAILQKRCQLTKLVRLIKDVRSNRQIRQAWKIDQFQKVLLKEMEVVINSSFRGKRSAREFDRTMASDIHPKKRKIGNIQVYVDQSCRMTYRLQDFAKFIEEKMVDHCLIEKEEYGRKQERKPLSFIAKNQMRLMELAHQIFAKTSRVSQSGRASAANNRTSNNMALPEVNLEQNYYTPKNEADKSKRASAIEKKKDSSRDSVQILREMQMQKSCSRPKSPKFKSTTKLAIESGKKQEPEVQRCRSVSDNAEYIGFSFGKHINNSIKSQKSNGFKKFQQDARNQDNAFLFHSFHEDHKNSESNNEEFVRKEDFELGLIIQQIQRQTYDLAELRTLSSDIDSNQQNKEYVRQDNRYSFGDKNRKPFQILLDRAPEEARMSQLQQLMRQNDKNPEQTPMFHDITEQTFKSSHKKKPLRESIFRSERQNRLSSISEEASNYYSESKNPKNH